MGNRFARMALVTVALLVSSSGLLSQDEVSRRAAFGARLSGFREVPSVSTTGNGIFGARLETNNTISYKLQFSNLEGQPQVAHIHFGQPGVEGGVIATLCGGDGKPGCTSDQEITGTITAADIVGPAAQGIAPGEFEEVLRAIRRGVTYVNVHSDKFPDGEIRGQIWAPRHRLFHDLDNSEDR